jgi:ABC-type uncharacterized transport system fused permease/ATPase subunit
MFLPQRSYLPIGTLRAALSYPAAEGSFDDALITRYLALCRLSHLAGRLDLAANWSQALSPGEQQRLAFVRVFLNRPRLVFLDEASSAMDGETEEVLYAALPRELPGVTVISIAHRETLARFQAGELDKEAAQLAIEHFWAGALRRAVVEGDVETGSVMAGQSVGMVTAEQPVAEIIAELVAQAEAALAARPNFATPG